MSSSSRCSSTSWTTRSSTRPPAARSRSSPPRPMVPSPSKSPTVVPDCRRARKTRCSTSSIAGTQPLDAARDSGWRFARGSSRPTGDASGPRTFPRAAWPSSSPCRRPKRRQPRCPPVPDPSVVLIEDEPQIRRFLRATLTSQGYRLFEAATGADGLVEVGSRLPDVVVVDLGLPDMDGLDVIRRLREWSAAPIIVLSARGQEPDKVAALDAGADDYVSKPFGASELLARIRVALRHTAGATREGGEASFKVGDLQLDLVRRHVTMGTREIRLTPIEYKLLTTLVRHAGKVVTHQQLLREVWGPTHTDQAHYVRVYMAHLRHKLEAEPARPRYLLTEPGVGYRLAGEGDLLCSRRARAGADPSPARPRASRSRAPGRPHSAA